MDRFGASRIAGGAGDTGLKLGKDAEVLIRVQCNSGSDLVSQTHSFFCAYCECNFRPHVAQRLTLAAYELLQNGFQYGGIRGKVIIELLRIQQGLAIRVSNETIPARSARLREHVLSINVNAEAVFVEQLRRSMEVTNKTAALGLARLVFEAKLRLYVEVNGNLVIVSAVCSE
jgi:hypothetical protein